MWRSPGIGKCRGHKGKRMSSFEVAEREQYWEGEGDEEGESAWTLG